MVFEMPSAGGTFAERAVRLLELVGRVAKGPLVAAPQTRVADRAELQSRLAAVVAGGGEGLMLHLASAPVSSGRSDLMMKLKPHLDAEAVVVALRGGAGKYRGLVGSSGGATAQILVRCATSPYVQVLSMTDCSFGIPNQFVL
jgi:DNA ligase-1